MKLHLSVLPLAFMLAQALQPASTVQEEIRRRIERLREGSALELAGVTIRPEPLLPELYEGRGFEPLWTDPRAAADLLAAIRDLTAEGLDPRFYDAAALQSLPARPATPAQAAEADLLRSWALVAAAHDLRFGRVDPASLERTWGLDRPRGSIDPARLIAMAAPGAVRPGLAALAPAHFTYIGLKAALADLRAIQAAGGWPRVPDGPTLEIDSSGPRVPVLRERLRIAGDLPEGADVRSMTFDSTLAAAVRRFQHRHALNEDGVVGPATMAELNVPVERRIDRVRLNLERARWITHDLAGTFVAVNIAGQRVYFVRDGAVVWETRAIVGKEYTRTPLFSDTMQYIVLNPTWTVPHSINGEILSAARRNPGYLRSQNIRVIDNSGAVVRSPDLSGYTGATFPWTFRQEPGPANALGRIKFMFPNPYNVYLHDTPARSLFERDTRTFSHGCIRVQDPLRLAELLLDDPGSWSRTEIEAAIATGETQMVQLERPVPTLLLYWTASTDLHGELHFYRDVYDRDGALQSALDARR